MIKRTDMLSKPKQVSNIGTGVHCSVEGDHISSASVLEDGHTVNGVLLKYAFCM